MLDKTKIPFIADQAGDLAMLESIGKLKVRVSMELLYAQLKRKNIILPIALDEYLNESPDASPDEVIAHVCLICEAAVGSVIDLPTKAYFYTFVAVWISLQQLLPVPVPAKPATRPEAKPGEKGHAKKMTEKRPMNERGFKKG